MDKQVSKILLWHHYRSGDVRCHYCRNIQKSVFISALSTPRVCLCHSVKIPPCSLTPFHHITLFFSVSPFPSPSLNTAYTWIMKSNQPPWMSMSDICCLICATGSRKGGNISEGIQNSKKFFSTPQSLAAYNNVCGRCVSVTSTQQVHELYVCICAFLRAVLSSLLFLVLLFIFF